VILTVYSAAVAAAAGDGANGSAALLPTIGGVTGVSLLIILLVRELYKSSSGAWTIVREKNRTIHRLTWERDTERYIRYKAQGIDPGPDPGPYVPPTEEELKTW
jgi:hypothetical protein